MTATPTTYTFKLAWPPIRAEAVQFALEDLILADRATGVYFPLGGEKALISIDWPVTAGDATELNLTLTRPQADALECALGQAVGRYELLILHARDGASPRPYVWLVEAQGLVWATLATLRLMRDEQDNRYGHG